MRAFQSIANCAIVAPSIIRWSADLKQKTPTASANFVQCLPHMLLHMPRGVAADQEALMRRAGTTFISSSYLGSVCSLPSAPIATCGVITTGVAYVPPIAPMFDSANVPAPKTHRHEGDWF